MVSTSNCPPLVAMSVVTRWGRTFSSRGTHLTVMSGFLAVNSLLSACIRIMSPLFTVAMVRVVCATEGAAPNKVAAPSRALRTCFTITSLSDVEHMPTPCNYVHTDARGCQGSELRLCTDAQTGGHGSMARMPGLTGGNPRARRNRKPGQLATT